mgnify:CR=1 FL=1
MRYYLNASSFYRNPQFYNERILTPFMMGTSTSLTAEDNIFVVFMMENQLLRISRRHGFKSILAIPACPLITHINKSVLGYKTLKDFPANRFVDELGQKTFEEADEFVKASVQVYENVEY